MMRDFSRRSRQPELMDAEGIDFETFRGCLHDLAQVNVVTLAHRPTLAFLEQLRRAGRLDLGRPIRIVDVGSGYGDLLRVIASWAARTGVTVQLTGVDLNPWSAKAAAQAAAEIGAQAIAWETQDIFARGEDCDLVVSSLFTHHLDDDALVGFLRWMEAQTVIGWFVNDLHRHRLPYLGFALLARIMRWHSFVQHDGPVSIARAFTADEWETFLARAGLRPGEADVRWRFPFRLCVSRMKTAGAR